MRAYFLLFLSSLFFLQACATVEKPQVLAIREQKPEVSKVLAEAPKTFLKRKVAIARFTNETNYGKGLFVDENKDQIGKQAVDILSSKLAATEKFILLERADLEKINKELQMGELGNLKIPADYLILGSISEFGRKEVGEVGWFSRTKKQVAYAKVYIRLVDIHTGQVTYSQEGDGEAFSEAGSVMGVGARAGYDSSLNDKAISAAISKMVNNIVENLTDRPWRSYILSRESAGYIIAGGKSQGLMEGDVFGVYKKGEKIKNPQTNMYVELPGQLVGEIKVSQFLPGEPPNEIALASLVSGSLPSETLSDYYIQEKK
jgi:curli biogenesis system outer membrane secretion channel CsgG